MPNCIWTRKSNYIINIRIFKKFSNTCVLLKYSKPLKNICFMLYIYSNITYKLLRKFSCLFFIITLYSFLKLSGLGNWINSSNSNITYKLLRNWSGLGNWINSFVATITFDAATIDHLNQGSNGVFVFN